jgi:hypothetical protein
LRLAMSTVADMPKTSANSRQFDPRAAATVMMKLFSRMHPSKEAPMLWWDERPNPCGRFWKQPASCFQCDERNLINAMLSVDNSWIGINAGNCLIVLIFQNPLASSLLCFLQTKLHSFVLLPPRRLMMFLLIYDNKSNAHK